MQNLVVVGLQWGDEGKGKLVDFLSEKFDIVARFQGGSNEGHTVIIGDVVHKFQIIPNIKRVDSLCINEYPVLKLQVNR